LLECVAVYRIVQVEREIRIQIKQGSRDESVDLQRVAIVENPAEIPGRRSELYASAIAGVYVAEPVHLAGIHQIERDLARGVEVVAAKEHTKTRLFVLIESPGVVRIDIVAAIAAGALKRSIGIRSFVCDVRIGLLDVRAERKKSAACMEVAA